jgi:Carboxypeptidase regulatory-like domain/TonB-dependent Receptor Plug Domain
MIAVLRPTILALILAAPASGAQTASLATINGQVVDGASGVGLSDVRVQVDDVPGVVTDSEGRFHLAGVAAGDHLLTVSVVGYVLARRPVTVGSAGTIYLMIPLAEGTGTYSERVEVKGELFRKAEPGVASQQVLGSADLQNLRGLVLDDPVRALQVLPGVAATDDFQADFSVRGVDFGHIGLAIDGVASPFLSHTVQGVDETGSIGMVNSDILERVSLLNGSYPQRFGNRTGAQVEMTLREGSRDRRQARVSLSGSSASVVAEGPIGRARRGSWLMSIRKSYLDLLIKQVSDNNNFAFGFSDLAGRLAWDLTDHQQVGFSVVAGHSALNASQLHVGLNDPFVATNDAFLATGSWRYVGSSRLTISQHISATGGRYHNRSLTRVVLDDGDSVTAAWRSDLTAALGSRWTLDAGASVAHSRDRATSRRVIDPRKPAELREDASLGSTLAGAYGEARWRNSRGVLMAAGARVDTWTGTDRTTASPWLRTEIPLSGALELAAGTGVYRQFPDFNEVTGLRGTAGLESERAWQSDVGVARLLGKALRVQATVFHRRGGSGITLPGDDWRLVGGMLRPPDLDTHYVNAITERSSGLELQAQRRSPNGLSGWVSYTVGHTTDTDESTGERFDADFDQRHAVNLYALYRLTNRTNVSLKVRAATNFPVRGYIEELPGTPGSPVPADQPARYAISEARNTARLPPYARVDVRVNHVFAVPRGRLTLYVELMNVFDHTNWRTGTGVIRQDGEIAGLMKPLVPFVPSAGLLWEF